MLVLNDVKTHLRITHTDEDVYLGTLINVAYDFAENYTQSAIRKKTEELILDEFQPVITLPVIPVLSINSINYKDALSTNKSFADYYLNMRNIEATIEPAAGFLWPKTDNSKECISISYDVGFNEIPDAINQAVLLIIGSLYIQRENHIEVVNASSVPVSAEYLLNPYRVTI